MKKLKIDLLCKIILILSILYTFIIVNNTVYKTNYSEGDITLIGKIISMTHSEEKTDLIIQAEETIKVTYYNHGDYELGDYIKISGELV